MCCPDTSLEMNAKKGLSEIRGTLSASAIFAWDANKHVEASFRIVAIVRVPGLRIRVLGAGLAQPTRARHRRIRRGRSGYVGSYTRATTHRPDRTAVHCGQPPGCEWHTRRRSRRQ